jgi:hypothetical protein
MDAQLMSTEANEPWALDKMARRGVANFLTQYLDNDDTIKVLNINAPWGTGKSFFLENWKLAEQKNLRACIYFNAWDTDFSGDAFVSLVASIRDQLEDVIGTPQQTENILKKFTTKAAQTLIAATPAITKGIVKKLTSVDVDVVSSIIDQEGMADAAEKAIEKLIESNKETLNTVHEFKDVFSRLLKLAAATRAQGEELKPVYIFIDELDRCRPTFAIELLERIKHLFGVDLCRFIIATDTGQLSEAIRAVYGNGFDSVRYLGRFFDREYTLNIGDYSNWILANCGRYESPNIASMSMALRQRRTNTKWHDGPTGSDVQPSSNTEFAVTEHMSETQVIILALAKTFNPSLRDLLKITHHIDAIQSNIKSTNFYFFWAAYLAFLKIQAPTLYAKTLNRNEQTDISEITSQYTPRSFYFYKINLTVHEIFFTYLSLYKGSSHDAYQRLRMTDGMLQYETNAAMEFSEHHEIMSLYPTLVDLAYSIE